MTQLFSSDLSGMLETLLDGLEEGVTVVDVATGRLVFANDTAVRMARLKSRQEMMAMPAEALRTQQQFFDLDGAPLPLAEMPMARAYRGETGEPREVRALLAGNEEHWSRINAIPLFENGSLRYVAGIFNQLTAQRRAERALRFIARASESLAASLDYDVTTQALVNMVVPELADGCSLLLREEDGSFHHRLAHANPDLNRRLRKQGWSAFRLDAPAGPAYVLRTGQPSFIREFSDELIRAMTTTEENFEKFKALGYRQSLTVPVTARGRILGSLSLALVREDRRFDDADVALALELANRAAMAIDNARLYRGAQRALKRKDEEAHTSELLRQIGFLMASELDPDELVRLVTRELTSLLGARHGAFVPSALLTPEPSACEAPAPQPGSGEPAPGGGEPSPPGSGRLDVPVVSRSGEVLGGLVFDPPASGAFSERDQRLVTALAVQVGIALENARLFRQAREAEAKSHASEERLLLAFEAARLGYFDMDLQTGRMFASPRVAELLGLVPRDDGTLSNYEALVFPGDLSEGRERMTQTVRAGGTRVTVEYRIALPDGATRWIEAYMQLVLDAAGKPVRRIGIVQDITARRQMAEQALHLASEQAGRAEAEAARRRIAEILDSIGEPFFAVEKGERLRFANKAAEQLLGRGRDALVGLTVREAIPNDEIASALERCARAPVSELPLELELRLPGGEWFECRAGPFDEGVSVAMRDMTARKREREAEERRVHYEALRADVGTALASPAPLPDMLALCVAALTRHLGLSVASIWTFDARDKSFVRAARMGGEGRTPKLMMDHPIVEPLFRDRRPRFIDDLRANPTLFGSPERLERMKLNAHAAYPLLIGEQIVGMITLFSAVPMPVDAHATLAAIADTIAQGMVRKRAEQSLAERAAELARSNADLEHFAYVASHDLQEPLRMVASYTQLLARRYKGKLDPTADEFIHYAVDGVTRMRRLIEGLLSFSRVGTQGKPLGQVRSGEVVHRALDNLQAAIEDAGAQVVVEEPLPEVMGDEVQLEQLFQNLIGNGLKFRREAPPLVRIAAARQGEAWLFSVTDNGIGIEPGSFNRLFNLFQRLNDKDQYPGTGIGLAMCKKIVERHAGRIWLESTPGQGTTFFFTLAAVPTEAPEDAAP